MAPKRKCCPRQLELLVEFCEKNTDLALGRFSGGPQGNQASKRAWETLSCGLNSIGEGAIKTPEQWRRYWIELKAKVKCKAADSRRNASATGGGPSKVMPLTEIEMRILALVGPVAVDSNIITDRHITQQSPLPPQHVSRERSLRQF